MKIYFQNFGINHFKKRKITQVFNQALKMLNIKFGGFSVNVRFVDANEIQALNKQFREIDKVTDVLSFPSLEMVKGIEPSATVLAKNINPEDGLVSLGDIAICKKVCSIQAKEFGHTFKRELCFLALHGLLHLLGFDHMTEEDEKQMQGLAKEILEKQKVKRNV